MEFYCIKQPIKNKKLYYIQKYMLNENGKKIRWERMTEIITTKKQAELLLQGFYRLQGKTHYGECNGKRFIQEVLF